MKTVNDEETVTLLGTPGGPRTLLLGIMALFFCTSALIGYTSLPSPFTQKGLFQALAWVALIAFLVTLYGSIQEAWSRIREEQAEEGALFESPQAQTERLAPEQPLTREPLRVGRDSYERERGTEQ